MALALVLIRIILTTVQIDCNRSQRGLRSTNLCRHILLIGMGVLVCFESLLVFDLENKAALLFIASTSKTEILRAHFLNLILVLIDSLVGIRNITPHLADDFPDIPELRIGIFRTNLKK